MKNFSKAKSIILFVVFGLVFVLGAVFSFTKFEVGSKDFESFMGAMSLSNDCNDTITATYSYSENEETNLSKAITQIGNVLNNNGFKSANVYALGDKLKIEVSQPVVATDSEQIESLLSELCKGKFELRSVDDYSKTIEDDETLVVIDGWKHIKNISKTSYKGYYGVEIEFNDEGKTLYNSLNGKTIYMYRNGEKFPNSSNNSYDVNISTVASSMNLWFASTEYQDMYYNAFLAGTIPLNLDADSYVCTYMETTAIDDVANMNNTTKSFVYTSNITLIISVCILAIITLALFVIAIIKYRVIGLLYFVATSIATFTELFLIQAMPWIELSVPGFIALGAGMCFNFTMFNLLMGKFKEDYSLGKSIETSFEDAYKKIVPIVVDLVLAIAICGLSICFAGKIDFVCFGSILIITSVINALSILLLLPLLIYCYHSFTQNPKSYALKPRKEEN
ncbi:MAG: MMPL family transporter [Christensenellales bacterium]